MAGILHPRLSWLVNRVLCAAVVAAPLASGADDGALALIGARIVDGRGGAPSGDTVVVVQGDRIVAIGGPEVIPAGAAKIDLAGKTLLPGLIDTHTHPLIWSDDYQSEHLRRSSADRPSSLSTRTRRRPLRRDRRPPRDR